MRGNLLIAGAATVALMASPALASGSLASSGNMGGLLGSMTGGSNGGAGGYGNGGKSSQSSTLFKKNSEAQASRQTGSEYKKSTFEQRDTTIGGVYADPQFSSSKSNKSYSSDAQHQSNSGGSNGGSNEATGSNGQSGGHNTQTASNSGGQWGGNSGGNSGGGHSESSSKSVDASSSKSHYSASFPIAIQPTTIGGFSKSNESGSTHDNAASSQKSSVLYKATQSMQSGNGAGGWGPKH